MAGRPRVIKVENVGKEFFNQKMVRDSAINEFKNLIEAGPGSNSVEIQTNDSGFLMHKIFSFDPNIYCSPFPDFLLIAGSMVKLLNTLTFLRETMA